MLRISSSQNDSGAGSANNNQSIFDSSQPSTSDNAPANDAPTPVDYNKQAEENAQSIAKENGYTVPDSSSQNDSGAGTANNNQSIFDSSQPSASDNASANGAPTPVDYNQQTEQSAQSIADENGYNAPGSNDNPSSNDGSGQQPQSQAQQDFNDWVDSQSNWYNNEENNSNSGGGNNGSDNYDQNNSVPSFQNISNDVQDLSNATFDDPPAEFSQPSL